MVLDERTRRVYARQDAQHRALTDRMFALLAVVLWTATIAMCVLALRPERVDYASTLWSTAGLLLAGLVFVAAPVACTVRFPGNKINPYLAAASLGVCCVLFVRFSGNDESVLAAFVVLAFLSSYRSVGALSLATVIIVFDVGLRTLDTSQTLRTMLGQLISERSEDVMWLLIFDLVLYAAISRTSAGLRKGSAEQANLEAIHEESVAIGDRKLQESELVKTMIFEAAPDAVIRYDADLSIVEINSVAEKLLRIDRSAACGRALTDFVPDLGETPSGSMRGDGREPCAQFTESKILRSDGTEFVAEYCTSEVLGLATKQFAIFIRDITERKALESQLSQSQKLQSIGQLAAGIAHEINTPTQYVGDNTRFLDDSFRDIDQLLSAYSELEAAAKAYADLEACLQSVEEEKDRADLEFLRAEIPNSIRESLDGIDRISVIVRALKDFSHPGVEGMSAADVNRILESTATVARNEYKYVADLELDLCPTLPPILCLPGELGQVALNLIVNASHAIADKFGSSGEKGLIRIASSFDDEFVTVKISDNGSGIPAAVRERVFDPFFTTKEVGKGTGQGLAIAHNVVVGRHKGLFSFETEEGKGTTFIFRIPLDLAAAGEEKKAAA
ncbi:MAG TPA: ATP-binding protein [Fimbriimonadaceae bacterium]|nr:ATP-binding protein [Fimbriimonadaceae bacterium]